ncbi:tyrosine-type recombinase/integrase [Deinococcus sp. HMF7620]|uniref:Tyrosine-type recombinase/integrase n=1 Tax=Deinococcus arboris TaxID=2682977 RepID=A0A7C9MAP4_9DEIO|nr:tyrosine-type recombinase/integrase [Deinococcus arboris]
MDLVFTAASGNHAQGRHLDHTKTLIEETSVLCIRFHDLRYTAAILLIRRGVPTKMMADRLGHANAISTLKAHTYV